MTEIRRSDPATDAAPDIEDVLTGCIEEMLRLDDPKGGIATEWAVIARTMDAQGKIDSFVTWSPGCDEIIARGLVDRAASDVNNWDHLEED